MAGLALLAASPALVACTDSGPAPDAAADDLAGALGSGELPEDLFTDGSEPAQQEYDDVVAGLGDLEPTVEVAGVATGDEQDGAGADGADTATATLTWTWDLGGAGADGADGADRADRRWTYETDAALELPDGAEAWQVVWERSLVEPSLGDDEVLDVDRLTAERAPILGARGSAVVEDRPVVRIGIDKTRVSRSDAVSSARRLAAAVGVDAGDYAALVRSSGDQAFVEAIVLRRAEAQRELGAVAAIRGAAAIDDTLPLAPTREFAAAILGRVGPATAEIVEESDGRVVAGDDTGVSGLQLRYDEQLAGTPGAVVSALSGPRGSRSRELFRVDPAAGEPLRTTLDPRLQTKAERVLAAGPTGSATALVALRPSDGAILAAASGPGSEGLNTATYGQYAPGSTFKVVSALALLRAGVSPSDRLTCPATTTVDGKQFKNYDDFPVSQLGALTLREALAYSCNTAFIDGRERLGEGDLAAAAAALGVGADQDLGFPAYFGQVPPPQSQTEAAADLIGQGRVLASPMAMATVAASVADGRTVTPYLLEDARPEQSPDEPLTGAEARTLRTMMQAVVAVGSGTVLQGVAEGAKTGTAEYGEPGADGELATHAWMIAFRGDLAVAAFVETGDSGSSTAGPLLRLFLSP